MVPFFTLKGTPYEIGYQHGSQVKDLVERSVNNYMMMFIALGGSWEAVCDEAKKFIPTLEQQYPEVLEEMKGLAEGSGQAFEAILVINSRSELLVNKTNLTGEGCTSFAVLPEKTGGSLLIGQNWDFPVLQKDNVIVLEIEQPGKPKILMITEAGIVGKIGFNEAGVGICMNAIIADALIPGTPLHIVMRSVLNSANLNSALDKVIKSKTASAINFIIAQHDLTAVNMEIIPGDFELTFPSDGFVAHTNHIVSCRLLGKIHDIGREMGVDSFFRLDRVNRLLAASPKVDLATLKQILGDHFNHPAGICRHLDESDPMNIASLFSVVMDLANKEMHILSGQPCENEFITIKLT